MVRVEPLTQAWAEALALGDDVFAERFGISVEPGWEGFPEVMAFLAEVRHASTPAEWGLHLVFDEDAALVGNAGWKGEPVDGAAELGYAVAPSRRGRGIATAVVGELLARARAARLRTVVAHTLGRTITVHLDADSEVPRAAGTMRGGRSNDARFVQVMRGPMADAAEMGELRRRTGSSTQRWRVTDRASSATSPWSIAMAPYTDTAYYLEADAHLNEGKDLPPELEAMFEE